MLLRTSAILVALLLPMMLHAQVRSWSTWVFGDGAGVTFVSPTGDVLDSAVSTRNVPSVNIVEGVGIYCDSITGQLLCTTTPSGLASVPAASDALAAQLAVGTSSTQAGLIVPVTGAVRQVAALIVADRTGSPTRLDPTIDVVRFGILQQGSGGISVATVAPRPRFTTERVCGARLPDASGYMLYDVAEDSILRAWRITPFSVSTDPLAATTPLGRNVSRTGQMKISRSGRAIAIASTGLFLVDVDPNLGTILQQRVVRWADVPYNGQFAPAGIVGYGCAWAPGERFLYATIKWQPTVAMVLQFDTRAGSVLDIARSAVVLDSFDITESNPPALQLGPDGRIYMPNGRYLNVIRSPDRKGDRCRYARNHLDLSPGIARSGLPSCIESDFRQGADPAGRLSLVYACEGDSVVLVVDSLAGTILRTEVELLGTSSGVVRNSNRPTFRAPSAGRYTAELRLVGVDTIVVRRIDLSVDAVPTINAGADTLRPCFGENLVIAASGAPDIVPTGSGIDILARPTPTSVHVGPVRGPARVILAGTVGNCTGYDTITIIPRTVQASITSDTALCLGESVDVAVTGALSVRWLDLQGALATAQRRRPSPLTDTTFRAEVSDGQCTDTLSMRVRVFPLPTVGVSDDAVLCPGDTTTLTATGGVVYRWSPSEGLDDATVASPRASPRTTTVYSVTVIDANGCSAQGAVRVNMRDRYDVPVDISDATITADVEGAIAVTISADGVDHQYGVIIPRPFAEFATTDGLRDVEIRQGTLADTMVFRLPKPIPAGPTAVSLRLRPRYSWRPLIPLSATIFGADGCAQRTGRDGAITVNVCGGRYRAFTLLNSMQVLVHQRGVVVEHDPSVRIDVHCSNVLGQHVPYRVWQNAGHSAIDLDASAGVYFMTILAGGESVTARIVMP
jgi:hypothetical protein